MARNRKDTKILFAHCSATLATQDIGAREINQMHLTRGIYSERGLTGYHLIHRRNGIVELGRDLPAIGAHVLGHNDNSIGLCLVGGARLARKNEQPEWDKFVAEDNFTVEQLTSFKSTIVFLKKVYPDAILVPHHFVSNKACPSFDLWAWQAMEFGVSDRERAEDFFDEGDGPESE